MLSHNNNLYVAAMVSERTKTTPQLWVASQNTKQGSSASSGGKPDASTKAKGQAKSGGSVLLVSNEQKQDGCIVNSGATNHMTFSTQMTL